MATLNPESLPCQELKIEPGTVDNQKISNCESKDDFADENKNDDWHSYAAEASARYTLALARFVLLRKNGNSSFRKSYLKDQVVWKLPRPRDSNSFSDVSLFQYIDFFNDFCFDVLNFRKEYGGNLYQSKHNF